MMRIVLPLVTAVLAATVGAFAQDLRLDDRDLAPYEDPTPTAPSPAAPDSASARSRERDAVSAPYDNLIDGIERDIRGVRNELRTLPDQVVRTRSRLESLLAAEEDLRREAYQRVVFRHPYPIYEDFDDAIEEALERREIRGSLELEIAENERAIARLEGELEELQGDLNEALRLRMEAVDEFNRGASPGAP